MKYINLYQANFRPAQIVLPARVMAWLSLVFLIGLSSFYGWKHWQLRQLKLEVAQMVQRADTVSRQVMTNTQNIRKADPNIAMDAHAIETRVHALQQAQEAIAAGELGAELGYSAYFRALARTVNAGTWLTGVTILDSGHAMDLQGNVLNGADAAHLIGNLHREPLFVGLSFAGLEMGAPASDTTLLTVYERNKPITAPRYLSFTLNARQVEASAVAAVNQWVAKR